MYIVFYFGETRLLNLGLNISYMFYLIMDRNIYRKPCLIKSIKNNWLKLLCTNPRLATLSKLREFIS